MSLKFYCRSLFTACSILVLLSSGSTAYATDSQNGLKIENILSQTRVTVNIKNRPLSVILADIEKQAKVGFVVKNIDEQNGLNNLTLTVSNVTLEQALNTLFDSTQYTYRIVDNTIMIVRREEQTITTATATATTNSNKTVTVKGKIVDSSNKPVAGATVIVIGTTNGAITDEDGIFTLKAPSDSKLEISSVGYITYTYQNKLEDGKLITIKLESAVLDSGDVIVTGIFNKSKESYTGAVTTMSSKDLQMFKGQNLLSTLKNIDPSLNVRSNNNLGSNPNALPEVTIRGNSSLPTNVKELNETARQQLNAPLVIMDGFEITLQRLADFNDQDIESINILKDAAATAIYGSRGANGVIVVVTKTPTEGKLRINVKAGFTLEIPDLSSYNLLDAKGKLDLEYKAGLFNSTQPTEDIKLKRRYNETLGDVQRGVDTYWLSQPVRTGITQNYNLSIQGGNSEFRWSAIMGYLNTQGAMKNSSRDNFNGSVTLSYSLKNVLFKNQISITSNKGIESNYGSFQSYTLMNPYWEIYDSRGSIIPKFTSASGAKEFDNPLYNTQFTYKNEKRYTDITNNFSIEWNITKDLKLKGQLGISKKFESSDVFKAKQHTDFNKSSINADRKGSYDYKRGESFNYDASANLVYSKSFNDKHQIFLGLDYSIAQRDSYDNLFKMEGYPSDRIIDVAGGLFLREVPSGYDNFSRRLGYTANANYTYDNRYFVDASYRLDGSSQFGASNKFAPFWSAGLGWNIHNEAFMKKQTVINNLRLRGSAGETGSQQFQAYQALSKVKYYTGNRYMNWSGAYLLGLGNENLKWQITEQLNAGIDLGFFNNRITASFDIYQKKTDGLVSAIDISPSHGFSSYSANVGQTVSKGYEAMLSGYIVRDLKSEFILMATAKLAYNNDKVTKLSLDLKRQNQRYQLDNIDQNNLLFQGYAQHSIYVVRSLGIDPSSGDEIFVDRNGEITRNWEAQDKVYMGVLDPKYRGNFSTFISYKNLSLNLSFGYHWGGVQYNQTLVDKVEVTASKLNSNLDRRVLEDRWFEPGQVKPYKRIDDVLTRATSRFVMPDRVFELQSASLQYIWNSPTLREKTKFNSINFGLEMSDVFYISSVKRERGIDYPFARRIGFNVTLSF